MPRTIIQLSALMLLVARADAREVVRVIPKVYDPDEHHRVFSGWTPFGALELVKWEATSAPSAAGAEIEGVDGMILRELGFDSFDPGHCGAGAPRFHVTLAHGSLYFFGCADGEQSHSPLPLFTRVRFRDEDAAPQYAT